MILPLFDLNHTHCCLLCTSNVQGYSFNDSIAKKIVYRHLATVCKFLVNHKFLSRSNNSISNNSLPICSRTNDNSDHRLCGPFATIMNCTDRVCIFYGLLISSLTLTAAYRYAPFNILDLCDYA
jgi:hypothetical protein